MPIVSANRGEPVTATGRPNATFTSIDSPSWYVLALAGVLDIVTALTAGVVNVPPATLWPPLFVTALAPSPKVASNVPPATLIVPPFSANALAPMLMPVESASPLATTYRNTKRVRACTRSCSSPAASRCRSSAPDAASPSRPPRG